MRLEPDREGLGEILGGMGLGVPGAQMLHEAAAAGPRPVGVRIGKRGGTEGLAPGLEPAQTVCGINGVAGLVAQNAHEPVAVAALHFAHKMTLESDQPLVGEIERDGDAGNAIGREPFLSQPAMRAKAHAAHRQFAVKALDGVLQLRAGDA